MAKALLILDMLNTFEFAEAKQLLPHADKASIEISKLKSKFKEKGLPVIYVNDNFDNWQSNWEKIFELCTQKNSLGRNIATRLRPLDDDYFVLKPMHSGFYSTSLDSLLDALKIETLFITGIAGNICVLFTVNDAHMRHYKIVVPEDCIASNTLEDNEFALRQFRRVFEFDTPTQESITV